MAAGGERIQRGHQHRRHQPARTRQPPDDVAEEREVQQQHDNGQRVHGGGGTAGKPVDGPGDDRDEPAGRDERRPAGRVDADLEGIVHALAIDEVGLRVPRERAPVARVEVPAVRQDHPVERVAGVEEGEEGSNEEGGEEAAAGGDRQIQPFHQ